MLAQHRGGEPDRRALELGGQLRERHLALAHGRPHRLHRLALRHPERKPMPRGEGRPDTHDGFTRCATADPGNGGLLSNGVKTAGEASYNAG